MAFGRPYHFVPEGMVVPLKSRVVDPLDSELNNGKLEQLDIRSAEPEETKSTCMAQTQKHMLRICILGLCIFTCEDDDVFDYVLGKKETYAKL